MEVQDRQELAEQVEVQDRQELAVQVEVQDRQELAEQVEVQVHQELVVLQVQVVLQEQAVQVEVQDRQELRVHQEHQELQEHQDLVVMMEILLYGYMTKMIQHPIVLKFMLGIQQIGVMHLVSISIIHQYTLIKMLRVS